MFSYKICSKKNCKNYAVSGNSYCFLHTKEPEQFLNNILEKYKNYDTLKNFVLCDFRIENKKIPCKSIITSKFSGSTFNNVVFNKEEMKLCFFDYCKFENCTFSDVNIKYSVFGGSVFLNCNFTNSEFLHTNFNGSSFTNCKYKSCDLYFSSFIKANFLSSSDFIDCNLKKVNFSFTKRENITFKYSNDEEAIFSGSGIQ